MIGLRILEVNTCTWYLHALRICYISETYLLSSKYCTYLPPANEVLGQGNVFTGVCPQGGETPPRVETATEAGSTHPTGMHSCFS